MYYLSADSVPRPGDRVITSGVGVSFPKGLLIGYVRESTRAIEDSKHYIVVELSLIHIQMCIRDREKAIRLEQGLFIEIRDFLSDQIPRIQRTAVGLKTVSYTHLDVYKRQDMRRLRCRRCQPVITPVCRSWHIS